MHLKKKVVIGLTGLVALAIVVLIAFGIRAASKSLTASKQEGVDKSLDTKTLAAFKSIYSGSGQYYKTNGIFPWNNSKEDVLGSFISTNIATESMADKLVKGGLVQKQVFTDILNYNYNTLLISRSNLGNIEVHICFQAKSADFIKQAQEKCASYDSYVKSKACQPEAMFICVP